MFGAFSPTHLVTLSLVAVTLLGVRASQAGAGLPLPVLIAPVTSEVVAPVAASSTADPAISEPRGTMILVHGGAWLGHSVKGQQRVMDSPGQMLRDRGWRIVSVDYEEGKPGLQNILDAIGAELRRAGGHGPLCVYGESAGAHLALVAASRLGAIDCVIGVGTPTDLTLLESARASDDIDVRNAANRASAVFGTTAGELAPWNPLSLARTIRADVLLLHEIDDPLVPATHAALFQAALPTTHVVELEAGDTADLSTHFAHGTISPAARVRYLTEIATFTDRAQRARSSERSAAYRGCTGVRPSIARIGSRRVLRALRCLARSETGARPSSKSWRRSTLNLHGAVNAARLWAALRRSASGRRALAASREPRTVLTVRSLDPSRVVLRSLSHTIR